MDNARKSLILPCETRNRELDAKVLLACVAAERGFRVFVGAKREINIQAARLPRSIYFQKSLSKRSYRMYDILQRTGHWIVSNDEEGVVYFSRERYWEIKIHPQTLHKARALFAWGQENEEIWNTHPAFHGVPIEVTGNPRVDLLRPELRTYFDTEVNKLRDRFGSFVLINSNFSYLNHFFPNLGYGKHTNTEPAGIDFNAGLVKHGSKILGAFLEMLPALARARPDCKFVVRPHPSENHALWERAASDWSNVHIIHEGNIVPWLIVADAVIHNGCTTAIEAYVVGTPAIAYQPVVSDRFDQKFPNAVSDRATNLAELAEMLEAARAGTATDDRASEARKGEWMDRYIAGRSGPLASDCIVDALERFENIWRGEPPPSAWRRATGRLHGELRSAEKWVNLLRPYHNNNRSYVRHIFSELSLGDIRLRIERLRKTLGRFSDVRAREFSSQVYELVAPDRA